MNTKDQIFQWDNEVATLIKLLLHWIGTLKWAFLQTFTFTTPIKKVNFVQNSFRKRNYLVEDSAKEGVWKEITFLGDSSAKTIKMYVASQSTLWKVYMTLP